MSADMKTSHGEPATICCSSVLEEPELTTRLQLYCLSNAWVMFAIAFVKLEAAKTVRVTGGGDGVGVAIMVGVYVGARVGMAVGFGDGVAENVGAVVTVGVVVGDIVTVGEGDEVGVGDSVLGDALSVPL